MNNLSQDFIVVTRLMYQMDYGSVKYFAALKSLSIFKEKYKENKAYMKVISLCEKNKLHENYSLLTEVIGDFAHDFEEIYEK